MIKSSTVVSIPFYAGIKGNLLEAPWTTRGTEVQGKIHWVVPLEVQYPDGWAIFKVRVVPRMSAYRDNIVFEVWDKYMLSKPKLVGKVKINANDNTYEVELEPRYHCMRLTMMLTLIHTPQEPFETNAYRNSTPYGDWSYKDKI